MNGKLGFEVLKTMVFPGGDRKLVMSECGEFLVLTRACGEIKVEVFNDKETAENKFYGVGIHDTVSGLCLSAVSGR